LRVKDGTEGETAANEESGECAHGASGKRLYGRQTIKFH